jgi:hypothetical protein
VLFISLGGPSLIARVSFVRPWRSIDPPQRAGRLLLLLLLLWVSFFFTSGSSRPRGRWPSKTIETLNANSQQSERGKNHKQNQNVVYSFFFPLYSLFFFTV